MITITLYALNIMITNILYAYLIYRHIQKYFHTFLSFLIFSYNIMSSLNGEKKNCTILFKSPIDIMNA